MKFQAAIRCRDAASSAALNTNFRSLGAACPQLAFLHFRDARKLVQNLASRAEMVQIGPFSDRDASFYVKFLASHKSRVIC